MSFVNSVRVATPSSFRRSSSLSFKTRNLFNTGLDGILSQRTLMNILLLFRGQLLEPTVCGMGRNHEVYKLD
jgi:hypothetical protein